MIEPKDVITIKIPFPTIADNLAIYPHMYICLENNSDKKKLIKCQTLKPLHLGKNKEPYQRIIEDVSPHRNPFKRKTLIDCDKVFAIEGVKISTELLTRNRRDVCEDLFNTVKRVSDHPQLKVHTLDCEPLTKLNSKIKLVN